MHTSLFKTSRLLTAALLMLPLLSAQSKRSVSVEPFDYSTIKTDVQTIFGTQVDIGRGISALVMKRIADSGCFTVVERQKLDVLTREQDLGASGRVKKGTQARTGEIRGADFALVGDIVSFGRDDSRKAAGAVAVVPGAGGAGGGYSRTGKAVVTLNFRMANAETSVIVMTGEATGVSSRTSKGGFAGLFVGGIFAGGFADFSARNFSETIIGEAVIDAANKLVAQLKCDVGTARRSLSIDGRVAAVSGPTVTINVGAEAGVAVGDTFELSDVTGEVRDPVTKEVLDLQATPIGQLVITSVRPKIAIGAFTGSKPPKVGDKVEKR